MSTIHYFQRYSQPENVATNNTLLLFSRLYNLSPLKFKLLLNELIDEINLDVGVNFAQQQKSKNSVPDGFISQESFKIAIETKMNEKFSTNQLIHHLDSFGGESIKILMGLSPIEVKQTQFNEITKRVKEYNASRNSQVVFISITFKLIISAFREIIDEYDIELHSIIDDYEEYCISSKLMVKDQYRLLAVGCGYTITDNFKNSVYYDPADRGYSYFSHLGIYDNKRIKGIGKIENIVTADWSIEKGLIIKGTTNGEVTEIQKLNIINSINDAKENLGWDISRNNKFFCVTEFVETCFKKSTKRGLFGKKYFNLNHILGRKEFADTHEIAELLKTKHWS